MKKSFILALLTLTLFLITYYFPSASFNELEHSILDYRFKNRQALEPDSRIVIIGLDQNSLSKIDLPFFAFGQIFAQVTNYSRKLDCAGIIFDVVFPPSTEKAIRQHIKKVAKELGLELPHSLIRKLGFEREFRSALLKLKISNTNLVIGYGWEKDQKQAGNQTLYKIAGAKNTGFFNLPVDGDNKIRRAMLQKKSETGKTFNSIAYLGAKSLEPDIAINKKAYQQINFCGPGKTFKTIPLIDFLEMMEKQNSSAKELKDKLLLTGFTDITDFKSTPYGYMPGVEIHANIIDNILNQRFLKRLDKKYELLFLLIIILAMLVIQCRSPLISITAGILGIIIWLFSADHYFSSLWIPTFKPVFLLTATSTIFLLHYLLEIYSDRKRIKSIFKSYVSDSVLDEILATESEDFISGQRRELCILIADIRGFTSFSEKFEADEVVNFLNAYFARITDIIMQNRGVVDKFLGDGVLAFFNAPVENKNFVNDAIKSAVQIRDYVNSEEFRDISRGVNLKTGMALHVGSVVFGNVGSEKKAEFTVIGDAVNTCSRMESLNKEYSTSLIVSDKVVELSETDIKWKLIEEKILRGKTEKIKLYTDIKEK
ncbi:MAG: CHASE2 domain-containing protein [Candidatus Rifleibacteriota bacterium]